MKKTLKFSMLALAISLSVVACDPPHSGTGANKDGDSLPKDKTATPADTLMDTADTANAKPDSLKK